MKKVFWFIAPLLIAVVIFFGILFFWDRKTGKGALQVTSIPQSSVYLDGKLVGKTPICIGKEECEIKEAIDIGEHNIKLIPVDPKYSFFEVKIPINKLTLTAVDRTFADGGNSDGSVISLIPLDNKKDIEILVISFPDKANVFLDNNPVGITPLLLKQVSESEHDLRIIREGYEDKSIKIKTALGFKLSSLVFLGVNLDLSNDPVASPTALLSPASDIPVPKVLILNTPTGFLRVRESNSLTSLEIAQVKPGETHEYVSEKEGWFEIKINSGKVGWISASYATKE